MIKGIIFDMDGTLIDTNQLIIKCIQDCVEKYLEYRPQENELVAVLGKPLKTQMGFFSAKHTDDMMKYYRQIYRENRDQMTAIYEGVLPMLENLKSKGIRMAIVSNKGSNGIQHALEKFEMEEYFDICLSSSDVENHKPHPEGIFKVLKFWGLTPKEILFVGDSINDILCANNANVQSVLVNWTILPPSHFESVHINYRVESTQGIIDILERKL